MSTDTNNRYTEGRREDEGDDSKDKEDELLITISSKNESSNVEEYFTFKSQVNAKPTETLLLSSNISN